MKLIDRYDFTNDRSFITYYLSPADTARMHVPECDVIGLRRRIIGMTESGETEGPMTVMRPDEALIMARMLIDAVNKVTESYSISLKESQPLATELVNDLQEMDHAAIEEGCESETRNDENLREEKR